MAGDAFEEFLAKLPKTEVHLHLEGAIPWSLARAWSPSLPERPDYWRRDHRFTDFSEFAIAATESWKPGMHSVDRIAAAGGEIYRGLAAQNVRYLEMSFGLAAHAAFSRADVVHALKRDVPEGMTVRIIGGVSRDRDVEEGHRFAAEGLAVSELDGVDIHGDERKGNLGEFAWIFEKAREMGKITKAHAGELTGPETVHEALDVLGVARVEHGVRAAGDADLVARFVDEGITLDMCPWSNVKLGVHPDLATHPLKALHRAGVRVTVNTDDPTPFGQTITDEYRWLHTEMGMTVREVGEIAANGFRNAWMDEAERLRVLAEIDELVTEYEEAND